MASRLENRRQYGLLSSGYSGADKTILQFKLTDSSLKSLEEYLKAKAYCSKRPTIHFNGNCGAITVPRYDETTKRTKRHEYKFTVQPIQAPEKSSLECIQQFRNKRGSEQLDSIGAMQTKISIHATDEVYKTTQERMKLADENMKRVSTQEVSQVNLKPGRKVKINSQTSYAKKVMSAPTSGPMPSSVPSAPPRTASSLTSSSSQLTKPRAIPPKPSAKPPPPPSSITNSFKPTQTKPSVPSQPARKSAVYNKPCRERIIHLLALKPYKKPEIVVRLITDGISEKEKLKIPVALKEVGSMMKDNTYVLNKNLYTQVREDWPLYSDEDRKTLRKRIEQLRTKESPIRPQSSPSPVKVEIDANTVKRKRIILPEEKDYTAPKKARIAHNRSHQPSEGKISPAQSNSSQPPTPQSGSYQPSVSSPSISTTKYSPDSSNSNDVVTPSTKTIPKRAGEAASYDDPYSAPAVKKDHQGTPSPAGQVSSSAPEYITEFPPITTKDQRIRYKKQFYKEYPEYEKISKDIMRVTEVFTDLKNRLANAKIGSAEHEQIEEKILAENKKVQEQRADFKTMSTRYKYLHEKLSYVKKMIANYDKENCH